MSSASPPASPPASAVDDTRPGERTSATGTVKRAFASFGAHGMIDRAAGLTYFLMMALFPTLLVVVSLLGLLGDEAIVKDAVGYASDQGAPAEAVDAIDSVLSSLVESRSGIGFALLAGVIVALYGASRAFGAAGRALNVVYAVEPPDAPEGQGVGGKVVGFVRGKAVNIGFTLLVIVLAVIALVSVFLGGSIAGDVFSTIGLGETAASVWRVARWGVALLATMLIYAVVYAVASDRQPRQLRWISAGAVAGVLIWMLASAGFFFYVANFGNYSSYGAFAGPVILLLWLFLTSIAFLFGAELNAELERAEVAGRGGPPPPSPPPSAHDPAALVSAPESARHQAGGRAR